MKAKVEETIKLLAEKAGKEEAGIEAQQFAQAALSLANALTVITNNSLQT